ncbi:hypothetical protein JCM3775_006596 [Rhodotorula graminis]
MPFNCFASSAHDSLRRHYTPHSAQRRTHLGTTTTTTSSASTATARTPYSTAALPPLQASARRRRSVHRLGSGGSGSGSSAAGEGGLDKARIGSPVGFRHLAHGGGGAAGTYAHRPIDLLAASLSPSLPPSRSHHPITPSVIRATGGVERVRATGGVPSRLCGGGGAAGTGAAGAAGAAAEQEKEKEREKENEQGQGNAAPPVLGDWFTPSELRAVRALGSASGGAGPLAQQEAREEEGEEEEEEEDEDQERTVPYETDTARALRGAMRDVEAALRAEEEEGEGTGLGGAR